VSPGRRMFFLARGQGGRESGDGTVEIEEPRAKSEAEGDPARREAGATKRQPAGDRSEPALELPFAAIDGIGEASPS
jgi:hypothetical protein